jgi:hypothetical protein
MVKKQLINSETFTTKDFKKIDSNLVKPKNDCLSYTLMLKINNPLNNWKTVFHKVNYLQNNPREQLMVKEQYLASSVLIIELFHAQMKFLIPIITSIRKKA